MALLGACAVATERVRLATGIIPTFTRTPTLAAMGFATLSSLAPGPRRRRRRRVEPDRGRALARPGVRRPARPHPRVRRGDARLPRRGQGAVRGTTTSRSATSASPPTPGAGAGLAGGDQPPHDPPRRGGRRRRVPHVGAAARDPRQDRRRAPGRRGGRPRPRRGRGGLLVLGLRRPRRRAGRRSACGASCSATPPCPTHAAAFTGAVPGPGEATQAWNAGDRAGRPRPRPDASVHELCAVSEDGSATRGDGASDSPTPASTPCAPADRGRRRRPRGPVRAPCASPRPARPAGAVLTGDTAV